MNSESVYRFIFENVHDGVLLRDAKTFDIIDVNPRFCELYGVSRDEILASRPGSFGAQGPLSGLKRLITHFKMAREGKPQTFEWQMCRRDGSRLWVEVNLREATIDGRSCFLSVIRDISDRKRIEEELRESQDRFHSALESVTDVFLILDYQWILRYANGQFERIVGEAREALLGRSLWDILPHMRENVIYERFLQAARERRPLTFETQVRGGHWVEAGVYPSSSTLSVYLKDITKRRKAEEALRRAEQRYRELVENANSIIMRRDPTGRISYFNEYAQKFFGFKEKETGVS